MVNDVIIEISEAKSALATHIHAIEKIMGKPLPKDFINFYSNCDGVFRKK